MNLPRAVSSYFAQFGLRPELRQFEADSDQSWQKWTKNGSMSPNAGPTLTTFGPMLTNVGPLLTNLNLTLANGLPEFDQSWPPSWSEWAKSGQRRTNFDRIPRHFEVAASAREGIHPTSLIASGLLLSPLVGFTRQSSSSASFCRCRTCGLWVERQLAGKGAPTAARSLPCQCHVALLLPSSSHVAAMFLASRCHLVATAQVAAWC